MRTFKIGDIVKWKSQAGGRHKEKIGEVVHVVGAYSFFSGRDVELCRELNLKSAYGGGMRRNHESYLVAVPHPRGGKGTLYWPRVSALELVE